MPGKVKGNNKQKLQKKVGADERIERMITRAMPQLPKELRRFIDKIERFDERQPATLMADLERDFNTFIQQLAHFHAWHRSICSEPCFQGPEYSTC
jgi:predicted Zn-dependent protease with MMP-like domain